MGRSLVKRRSPIEIQSGKGGNLTKEQLLDVKPEDRPDGTQHYAFGGDEKKKKKKEKAEQAALEREERRAKKAAKKQKKEDKEDKEERPKKKKKAKKSRSNAL